MGEHTTSSNRTSRASRNTNPAAAPAPTPAPAATPEPVDDAPSNITTLEMSIVRARVLVRSTKRRVYNSDTRTMEERESSSSTVRIYFDTKFDAIIASYDEVVGDMVYSAGQTDYIDYTLSAFIGQFANVDERIAVYINKNMDANKFNDVAVTALLKGAAATIERTHFNEGDKYVDASGVEQVHEHEGYNTNLAALRVTAPVAARLNSMMDKMMEELF